MLLLSVELLFGTTFPLFTKNWQAAWGTRAFAMRKPPETLDNYEDLWDQVNCRSSGLWNEEGLLEERGRYGERLMALGSNATGGGAIR